MTLKVLIHRHVDDGGFWGEVPALPGCYSEGETEQEVLANLREPAGAYIEVLDAEARSPGPEVQIAELVL